MLSPSFSGFTPELSGWKSSPESQVSQQEMLHSPSRATAPARPVPAGSSRQQDSVASLNTGQKS